MEIKLNSIDNTIELFRPILRFSIPRNKIFSNIRIIKPLNYECYFKSSQGKVSDFLEGNIIEWLVKVDINYSVQDMTPNFLD